MDSVRSNLQKLIKAIKIVIEIIGWLTIAGGSTLGAGTISFIIYSESENRIVALAILIAGFIAGAIWATIISIKYGTMDGFHELEEYPESNLQVNYSNLS